MTEDEKRAVVAEHVLDRQRASKALAEFVACFAQDARVSVDLSVIDVTALGAKKPEGVRGMVYVNTERDRSFYDAPDRSQVDMVLMPTGLLVTGVTVSEAP